MTKAKPAKASFRQCAIPPLIRIFSNQGEGLLSHAVDEQGLVERFTVCEAYGALGLGRRT